MLRLILDTPRTVSILFGSFFLAVNFVVVDVPCSQPQNKRKDGCHAHHEPLPHPVEASTCDDEHTTGSASRSVPRYR